MDSAIAETAALRAELAGEAALRRRLPRPLEALIVAGVVVGVIVAALTLNRGMIDTLRQLRAMADTAEMQASAAHAVMDALRDAETGQRGFLLTMKDEYLVPYATAQARLDAALATLDRTTASQPGLHQDVATLRELVALKMAELARSIDIAQHDGADAARAFVLTESGRLAMAGVLARTDALFTRARNAEAAREAVVHQRESQAEKAVLLAVIGGVLVLGALSIVWLNSRDRLLRAQQALRLQTARLAGAVEHLPGGVAVFDAQGFLLLCNVPFFALTGLRRELGARGTPWHRFADATAAWAEGALEGPPPASGVAAIEVEVMGRTLELWRGAMPDGGQMLGVADISRRVQAEAIARQATKMEAIGHLTGGIAHDFNNLLQVISANLELLASRVPEHPWLASRLTAALGGVDRAARLTRQLLAFARRQPLAPEVLDAAARLRGMDDMLRRALGEAVLVEMQLAPDVWAVRVDPNQLENAVLNLAINGRDAMPNGGRLTISAENLTLAGSEAEASEIGAGDFVTISVTDTGSGMTRDQMARAVEPFYSTKPEGRGTGLGLPMVYGFSKQSGGHFRLTSVVGQGTISRLYLPRCTVSLPSPAGQGEAANAVASAAAHGQELILVVEDDPGVRAAAVAALRSLGYRTAEAGEAQEAIRMLHAGCAPDLLFSDVVMPGPMRARELARAATQLLPRLAVVFTSGYPENAFLDGGPPDATNVSDTVLISKPWILISKPWQIDALGVKLRAALDEAARRSPGPARALRVLLTEDDALVRMTTADLLADMGHEVLEAGSAEEALRLMAGGTPQQAGADLLITDIGLPDLDGLELAERVRAAWHDTPIIICSGQNAVATHDFVWLGKPYHEASLRQAIQQALTPVA